MKDIAIVIIEKFKRIRSHFVLKLFFSYLAFLVVSFGVVFGMVSFRLTKKEIANGQSVYNGVLAQAANYIEFNVREIRGIVDTVTSSESVVTALRDATRYYSHSRDNWNIITSSGHKQVIYNLFSSSSISTISLHSFQGQLAIDQSPLYIRLPEEKQNLINQRLESMDQLYMWLPADLMYEKDSALRSIMYIRKLPQPNQLGSFIGYASAKIPERIFQNILLTMQVTPHSSAILFNEENDLIASSQMTDRVSLDIFQKINEAYELSSDLQEVRVDNILYLAGIREIAGCDWKLMLVVPNEDITADIRDGLSRFLLWIMLAMLLTLPFVYLVSRSLSKRIVSLKNEMMKFSKDTDNNALIPTKQDEIGDLTDSFYTMRDNIRNLMEQQYRNGFEIKDLELQVLQSQINPHFLYNTLETIYWMGVKNDANEVASIAQKLGSFYKLSLSNGKTNVPLSVELQHVKDYTDIQNMRFGNRIHLDIEVADELMDYEMIKITLQPLVENAIQHGIREKKNEEGCITIGASIEKGEPDVLIVTIGDDGIGMNPEQLAHMMEKNTKITEHGYGVWNINERIRMTYGDNYGLKYSSESGEGTMVEIRIPAIKYQE